MATNQGNHIMVTDDDHGPILAIATWFLMTVMILAVFARVTIKLAIRHAVGFEDYLITAALVSGHINLHAMHADQVLIFL